MNSGLKYNFKCCNQRYPQSIHAMIRFTEAPVLCFHPAEVKSQSVESKRKENVQMIEEAYPFHYRLQRIWILWPHQFKWVPKVLLFITLHLNIFPYKYFLIYKVLNWCARFVNTSRHFSLGTFIECIQWRFSSQE